MGHLFILGERTIRWAEYVVAAALYRPASRLIQVKIKGFRVELDGVSASLEVGYLLYIT